jgi:hypothetical protein
MALPILLHRTLFSAVLSGLGNVAVLIFFGAREGRMGD